MILFANEIFFEKFQMDNYICEVKSNLCDTKEFIKKDSSRTFHSCVQ